MWLFGIASNLLVTSIGRGRVDDQTRRRLRMEPLLLDDAALARVEELAARPALEALAALPTDQRLAVAGSAPSGSSPPAPPPAPSVRPPAAFEPPERATAPHAKARTARPPGTASPPASNAL